MSEEEIQKIRDQQAKDADKRFREIYPDQGTELRQDPPAPKKSPTKKKKS